MTDTDQSPDTLEIGSEIKTRLSLKEVLGLYKQLKEILEVAVENEMEINVDGEQVKITKEDL